MLIAIQEEGCGFVGCAFTGLSYIDDVRPDEQKIEFWDRPVEPEMVKSGTQQWERWRLHNGATSTTSSNASASTQIGNANIALPGLQLVMYDTAKLRAIGGFFWQQLPEHCGCPCPTSPHGTLRRLWSYPAGVYHQELPTTIVDRRVAADNALSGFSSEYLIPGIRATWGIRIAVNLGSWVCGTGLPNH